MSQLAKLGKDATKTSRRDIAFVVRYYLPLLLFSSVSDFQFLFQVSQGGSGATTVSATLALAEMVLHYCLLYYFPLSVPSELLNVSGRN